MESCSKKESDKIALLQALLDDRLDVIATDHAPHTLAEKDNVYFNAPSGGPLVQHALPAMLEFVYQSKISLEKVVEKCVTIQQFALRLKTEGLFVKVILLIWF